MEDALEEAWREREKERVVHETIYHTTMSIYLSFRVFRI